MISLFFVLIPLLSYALHPADLFLAIDCGSDKDFVTLRNFTYGRVFIIFQKLRIIITLELVRVSIIIRMKARRNPKFFIPRTLKFTRQSVTAQRNSPMIYRLTNQDYTQ